MVLIFYHDEYINELFGVTYTYLGEDGTEDSTAMANVLLAYSVCMFILVAFLLSKQRIKFVLKSNINIVRTVGLSIAFVIVNVIILSILGGIVDLEDSSLSLAPEGLGNVMEVNDKISRSPETRTHRLFSQ